MARGRKPRNWVRLDCQGVLHGSINYIYSLEEQAVFIKMIAMAEVYGPEPGLISDNDRRALPKEYVAHELHCSTEILNSVISKGSCDNAMEENGSGIRLLNFQHYQFTEYDRQKKYRQGAKDKEIQLPEWIDKETWAAFLEVRKEKKAASTEYALSLIIKELEKFRASGDDPNEILKRSITNSWKGVFPLKGGRDGTTRGHSEAAYTGKYTAQKDWRLPEKS